MIMKSTTITITEMNDLDPLQVFTDEELLVNGHTFGYEFSLKRNKDEKILILEIDNRIITIDLHLL